MSGRSFASDNGAGVHPTVLAALAAAKKAGADAADAIAIRSTDISTSW